MYYVYICIIYTYVYKFIRSIYVYNVISVSNYYKIDIYICIYYRIFVYIYIYVYRQIIVFFSNLKRGDLGICPRTNHYSGFGRNEVVIIYP